MNHHLKRPDFVLAMGAMLSFVIATRFSGAGWTTSICGAVIVGLFALLLLDLRRKLLWSHREHQQKLHADFRAAVTNLRQEIRSSFAQQEALLSLTNLLGPTYAMPATRGWAASPDFLLQLSDRVLQERPQVVVELGSGVSTLVLAYALKHTGQGRLLSIDHEEHYAQQTMEMLKKHGFDREVRILKAPLVIQNVEGFEYKWYDLSQHEIPENIDMLIVDGPPMRVQRHARYPALPLLESRLSERALVIMDDGDRQDEREIVAQWCARDGSWETVEWQVEKGAVELRR